MDILKGITENIRKGEDSKVAQLTREGLDAGLSCDVLLNKGLFAGMEVVGKLFREEEMYIPEVLMAAKAMDTGIKVLEPFMVSNHSRRIVGKVILGTVKGDIHNLGKNLVSIMLKGAGFEVIDLGVNVSAEKFVEAALSEKAELVGMSALLTTTMPYMRTVIQSLKKAGFQGQVKTIVGGACVTRQFAVDIGADAYAENAGAAVEEVNKLLGLN